MWAFWRKGGKAGKHPGWCESICPRGVPMADAPRRVNLAFKGQMGKVKAPVEQQLVSGPLVWEEDGQGTGLWAPSQVWQGPRLSPRPGGEDGLSRGVGRILSWNVDGWNPTLTWLWDELAAGDIDCTHLQDTRWTQAKSPAMKAGARWLSWGGGQMRFIAALAHKGVAGPTSGDTVFGGTGMVMRRGWGGRQMEAGQDKRGWGRLA